MHLLLLLRSVHLHCTGRGKQCSAAESGCSLAAGLCVWGTVCIELREGCGLFFSPRSCKLIYLERKLGDFCFFEPPETSNPTFSRGEVALCSFPSPDQQLQASWKPRAGAENQSWGFIFKFLFFDFESEIRRFLSTAEAMLSKRQLGSPQ